MDKINNWIAAAVEKHAIAFTVGTMFGMWLIVAVDCYLRSQCR